MLIPPCEKWREEWLLRHRNAEVIVTDLAGNPIRAEYRTLSGGMYPVAYSFPEDDGFNLPQGGRLAALNAIGAEVEV